MGHWHLHFSNKSISVGVKIYNINAILNKLELTYAFLIIVLGMGFSAFLIYLDHLITGSIFSGLILISAATLFINRLKTNDTK